MKLGSKVKFDKDGSGNFDFHCDWNDSPEAVMELVNTRLKEYNLEVVMHENEVGDFYAFSIRPMNKSK